MFAGQAPALRARIGAVLLTLSSCAAFAAAVPATPPSSDGSSYSTRDGGLRFGNAVISADWNVAKGVLADLIVNDRLHRTTIPVTDPFSLTLKDGSALAAGDFRLQGTLQEVALPAEPNAARLAARIPGKAVEGRFLDAGGHVRIDWKLVQRDGSDYLREIVTVTELDQDVPITKVSLFGADAPDAIVVGSVDGSPVVSRSEERRVGEECGWRRGGWRGRDRVGF